jgi:hypothetical protein
MLVPNIIDEGRDKHRGDAMLKMIAAFVHEMTEGEPLKRFAGCVTPDEAALSHRLSTAALKSQTKGSWKLCRATPRKGAMSRIFVGIGFGAIQRGLFLHEAYRSGNFDRFVVAAINYAHSGIRAEDVEGFLHEAWGYVPTLEAGAVTDCVKKETGV